MRIRGNATAQEVAALLAALAAGAPAAAPDGYQRWRAARLAALRPAR